MELILQKIAERQAEFSTLPESVKMWVQFMRIWFFAGIVFTPWWKPARWVVITMLATATAIIATMVAFPNFNSLDAGSIIQLILWLPLLIYLIRNVRQNFVPKLKLGKFTSSSFAIWALGSTAIVGISTLFNIKNVLNLLL